MSTAVTPQRPIPPHFGAHLRHWRQHRRLSQQGLADEAAISTRHLSFVETGRALPSREMVLRLADRLQVPLRERNAMLVAAGYAPMYRERPLDDPALGPAREAVDLILRAHEPAPALAVDRHWTLVAANRMLPHLLAGIEPALLAPPLNVLRLSLDPRGLGPRIANLGQWREHLFERLAQQVRATADPALLALLEELRAMPVCAHDAGARLPGEHLGIALPLQLRTADGTLLSFISTTTVFGTAVDVTVQELTLESFFPADAATAQALQRLAATLG